MILAAGASSRLGEPKQNLEFRGKSLLNHALSIALETECEFIVVVTGNTDYNISFPSDNNNNTRVHLFKNTSWQEGIASSIRLGLNYLQTHASHLKQIIFMVCDQPYVTSALLNNLITEKSKTGKMIVACAYQDTIGTPVLFDQVYFEGLSNLKGDEGAKKIVLHNLHDVAAILFTKGYLDIDTKQDYNLLLKLEGGSDNA